MKFSVVLGCLAVSFLGCSGKEPTPDPYATVSMFCDGWAKAACTGDVVVACSGAEAADNSLTQACLSSQHAFCLTLVPAAGYSSENASQCLSAVQTAYGDGKLSAREIATVRHRGDPCNHLIKGPQAKGESCDVDDDCDTLNDYLCIVKGGAGTCQIPTLAANGDPCTAPEAACNAGYYCDENCVKSKAVGSTCAASFQCATGLVCDGDPMKCVAKVSEANCTKDDDCMLNKVCDIPVGASTGLCVSSISLGSTSTICEDLR